MPDSVETAKGDEELKDVYQILIENLTNERLDRIALQDKDYSAINEELDEVLKQYDILELSEKDADVINKAFELYGAQCAKHAHVAYRQGMEDAVDLLKEMGVIGK